MSNSASGDFVHLHVHTEYSMLDGAARLKDLFAEAARHGDAGAGDDRPRQPLRRLRLLQGRPRPPGSSRSSAWRATTSRRSRFDRAAVRRSAPASAQDVGDEGTGQGQGQLHPHDPAGREHRGPAQPVPALHPGQPRGLLPQVPRFDRELLERYGKGIIAHHRLPVRRGQPVAAGRAATTRRCQAAADYRDILGPDNFFCELMDHGLEIERRTRDDLLRLAKRPRPAAARHQRPALHPRRGRRGRTRCCCACRPARPWPTRSASSSTPATSTSSPPPEMRALWAELPEACDNTLLIAERCDVEFTEGAQPHAPVPGPRGGDRGVVAGQGGRARPGTSGSRTACPDRTASRPRTRSASSARWASPATSWSPPTSSRTPRSVGIRVGPGRGSAAGALIAYALGITELDPIKHGLLFERFLNPERISMPDIDMDFDERRRGDMIRYATEKYGEERVAQIITYGTIKAKAAIKDAARVLGYPFALGDQITKAMPPAVMGKDIPLAGHLRPEQRALQRRPRSSARSTRPSPTSREVVDTARGLEGLKRQWGVHAAGVILSASRCSTSSRSGAASRTARSSRSSTWAPASPSGLLKMDFLGLRNLTVLDDCLRHIEANRGETVVLEDARRSTTAPTYELLARGDTLGVFQLDGGPMRALLRSMAPDNFEDISAVLALYRPGPMGANAHNDYADRKNGRKPVAPIHPELAEPLAEILGDTYGLIVYQEQVMAIAQKLAGYSLGQRRPAAPGDGQEEEGDPRQGVRPVRARACGPTATPRPRSRRSGTSSSRSPTTPSTRRTPPATASSPTGPPTSRPTTRPSTWPPCSPRSRDDKDKSAIYLNECRRMGIKVLPPDVNESRRRTSPRSAPTSASGCRRSATSAPTSSTRSSRTRTRQGPVRRLRATSSPRSTIGVCNKRVVESLIKAGAFDSLRRHPQGPAGDPRAGHRRRPGHQARRGDRAVRPVRRAWAARSPRPLRARDWSPVRPSGTRQTLLAYEREMLGLYVVRPPAARRSSTCSAPWPTCRSPRSPPTSAVDGQMVTVAGLVTSVQRKTTKPRASRGRSSPSRTSTAPWR